MATYMPKDKVACLTLSLESDYGMDKAYRAFAQVSAMVEYLGKADVSLTCFVEGQVFEKEPWVIRELSVLNPEFELHSYTHARRREADVAQEVANAKRAYLEYFNREPLGYRFPVGNFRQQDYEVLWRHGYRFSSSIFPSWRPGEYNNMRKPVTPFFHTEFPLLELPFAVVSRRVRIPVSLGYMLLLGPLYLSYLKKRTLLDFIVFEIHMHDLCVTESYDELPGYYKLLHGRSKGAGLGMMCEFMSILKERGYQFKKMAQVYEDIMAQQQRPGGSS